MGFVECDWSIKPGGVELSLIFDAGVHLQNLSDGHGGIRRGRK